VETNPIIPFLLALAIIIFAARVFGSVARRIGQPRVLGELIAGVILGPTLLDMPHWAMFGHIPLHEMVQELAELGVLFLMFIIGLEVEISELAKVGRVAILAGTLGAVLPVALTIPAGLYFGFSWQVSLFAGVVLAATSVSISAQVLLELGHLRSKEGNALLATALIDDVLAILLLSITLAIVGGTGSADEGSGAATIIGIILRIAAYIGIAFSLSWFVLPRVMNWLARYPSVAQSNGMAALAIMVMLVFAWSAEALGGIAAITGAFIAGVGLSRIRDGDRNEVEETASHIAYAFLMPIFFISVGLETDLSSFPLSALPVATVLLIIGVVSKVGGCGLGAKLGGFSNIEALRLGVCMISRGEVGLIIAALGLSAGILQRGSPMFASLFLVILLTTVFTPIFVRMVFPKIPDSELRRLS
jgi:Kef-type K+ transport system membrane component KefB